MHLIDADKLKEKLEAHHDFFVNAWGGFSNLPVKDKARVDEITNCIAEVVNAPTIDPESLRPQGEWVWKHRHHGGFHRYTGVDDFGNTHTITVDERFECDEPYCLNCGKWNESVFLNYCPNCGACMKGAGEREAKKHN